MARIKSLGTINGFSVSNAKIGRKAFTFNGTVTGLTTAASKAGAKVGSNIKADFGGGFKDYVITAAPHDDRCGGVWASRV